MSFLLQKSFRLVDEQLVSLKSGHPILGSSVGSELSPVGFGATVSVSYWYSILAPGALCSFASEPGIRGIIEVDDLLSRKGVAVQVPSYRLVALSADYPLENRFLEELFPELDVGPSPDGLRRRYSIMRKRQAKKLLAARP